MFFSLRIQPRIPHCIYLVINGSLDDSYLWQFLSQSFMTLTLKGTAWWFEGCFKIWGDALSGGTAQRWCALPHYIVSWVCDVSGQHWWCSFFGVRWHLLCFSTFHAFFWSESLTQAHIQGEGAIYNIYISMWSWLLILYFSLKSNTVIILCKLFQLWVLGTFEICS